MAKAALSAILVGVGQRQRHADCLVARVALHILGRLISHHDIAVWSAQKYCNLFDVDYPHLVCTSFFPRPVSGIPTPEADGDRWAASAALAALCWPRMGELLSSLAWDA